MIPPRADYPVSLAGMLQDVAVVQRTSRIRTLPECVGVWGAQAEQVTGPKGAVPPSPGETLAPCNCRVGLDLVSSAWIQHQEHADAVPTAQLRLERVPIPSVGRHTDTMHTFTYRRPSVFAFASGKTEAPRAPSSGSLIGRSIRERRQCPGRPFGPYTSLHRSSHAARSLTHTAS